VKQRREHYRAAADERAYVSSAAAQRYRQRAHAHW